jgi:hypothetical protein
VTIFHPIALPQNTPERLLKMIHFDEFMKEIDKCLISKLGLSSNDIADAPWREWFEDEMEVECCCALALYDYNEISFEMLETIGLGEYI